MSDIILNIGTPFCVIDYALDRYRKESYGIDPKGFYLNASTLKKMLSAINYPNTDEALERQQMSYKGVLIHIDKDAKVPYMISAQGRVIEL